MALLPFDSEHKYMATLNTTPEQHEVILVKGAPDRLLDRAATQLSATGALEPLDRAWWEARVDELSAKGLRVLAAASRPSSIAQSLDGLGHDDLIDLKHSVNRAYRGNARYMMNDLSVAVVSKLKDTTGRPIWVPAVVAGAPDTLCGFPVAINDDVAVMAANALSIAFGDFSKYTIRDVANTTVLKRFDDSNFALQNQVGFCGWTRSGGNLLDTAAIRVYKNSAT